MWGIPTFIDEREATSKRGLRVNVKGKISYVFYFLCSDALTYGALMTPPEGWPLLGLTNP